MLALIGMKISMFSDINVTRQMASIRAKERLYSVVAMLSNASCALELAKATTRTAEALFKRL